MKECRLRGVSYEIISSLQVNNIYATIDENNAVQLAVGAYTGGVTGTVVGSGAVVQEKEIGRPRTLTISQALEKAIRHIDVTSALGSASFGAIITDSGTIDGNCGGSLSYTINIDDVTGDFTGNFNFNNYCDTISKNERRLCI